MPEINIEKIIKLSIGAIIVVVIIDVIHRTISNVFKEPELTLTHLGSGNFLASPEERTIFEFARDKPFTISGYINLKNMVEGDTVIIREYIKMGLDVDYTLYHEEPYNGKQITPMLHISKRPAMKGVKITIQQTSGEPKYFQWEFYGGFTG